MMIPPLPRRRAAHGLPISLEELIRSGLLTPTPAQAAAGLRRERTAGHPAGGRCLDKKIEGHYSDPLRGGGVGTPVGAPPLACGAGTEITNAPPGLTPCGARDSRGALCRPILSSR
jgi:hypothetical protein